MNRKRSPRSLFGPAALACAAALMSFTSLALAQQATPVLSNNVPLAVSNGQAALVAHLSSTQQLYFSIVLPLRNEAQLQNLLNQLYDSNSPNYRQFLTVPQFTQMFGPTADDYNALVKFAQASGFTVTGTPADRMSVPVQGTVAQIESAFHVKMNIYQHPTENRLFFSLDRQPSLNFSVPVQAISGLNNFSPPRPALSKGNGQANVNGSSGDNGAYLASDMRAAYYTKTLGATGLTGNGQCVSLVEFGGYDMTDNPSYSTGGNDLTQTLAGQSGANTATSTTNGNGGYSGNTDYLLSYTTGGVQYTIPINNVPVNGGNVGTYDGDELEVVIDMAQAIGMAPGMSQLRVYIAPDAGAWTQAPPSGNYPFYYNFPSSSDDYAIFEQMINDYGAGVGCNQASISWNWAPEDPLNDPDNYAFQEFNAIGISFFAAAGDNGSWNSNFTCYYTNPYRCYFYPEETPYVTTVGGTDLTTSGAGGSWVSESGWSYSGGGISPDDFPIPSYQSGNAYQEPLIDDGTPDPNETSTSYRDAPDVAMDANFDNYVCSLGSCTANYWGGTSFAAPRWAGFAALVNQQSAANNQPSIGFLNPYTYTIGEDYIAGEVGENNTTYLTNFNEIEEGSNGGYSVLTGEYNMVTGWGSPKGQALIDTLAPRVLLSADGPVVVTVGGPAILYPITITIPSGFSDPSGVALKALSMVSSSTLLPVPINEMNEIISIPLCIGGEAPPGTYTCYLTIDVPAPANPGIGDYTVTIAGTNGNGVLSTTAFTLDVEN